MILKAKHALAVGAILAGFLLAFFTPFLWEGRTFLNRAKGYSALCGPLVDGQFPENSGEESVLLSDPVTSLIYNEPMSWLIRKQLLSGHLPHWSRQLGIGQQVLAVIQPGFFFPPNWIAYGTPGVWGIDLSILFKMALGFLGFFGLLRRGLPQGFGFSITASLAGAMIYAFTGHAFQKANMNSLGVYAIAPFYLWSIFGLHGSPSAGRALGLGVASALLIFAGFPETTLAVFYLGVLVHGWLFWASAALGFSGVSSRISHQRRTLKLTALGYLLGGLWAAPQLLPLAQVLSQLSTRYRLGNFGSGLAPISFLDELVFPRVTSLGSVLHPGWMGPVALAAAIAGWLLMLDKRFFRYWILLGAVILYGIKAFNVPGLFSLYGFVPFLKILHFSRDFSLWLWIPVCFGVALAVDQLHTLSRDVGTKRRRALFLTLSLITVVTALTITFHSQSVDWRWANKRLLWQLGCLCLWFPLSLAGFKAHHLPLLFLATLSLVPKSGATRTPIDLNTWALTGALKDTLNIPDTARLVPLRSQNRCPSPITANFGFSSVHNVDPLVSDRFFDFHRQFFECVEPECIFGIRGVRGQNRILPWQILGANYFVTGIDEDHRHFIGHDSDLKPLLTHKRLTVWTNPLAFPKAMISYGCRRFSNHREVFNALFKEQILPSIAYLELSQNTPCSEDSGMVPVDVQKYGDYEVVVKTELSKPGWLVLTDAFHPDWRAFVDGKSTPTVPAFGMYRAVPLPQGAHTVEFRYFPFWFYIGTVCFWAGTIFSVWLSFA